MAEIHWSAEGLRIRCSEHGFSVAGDCFYVFEERLPAALEKASLLRRHPPDASAARPGPSFEPAVESSPLMTHVDPPRPAPESAPPAAHP
jgi:hypothetical protein